MTLETDYWNHNIHYQPVILDAVPPGCATAVDVGCGDGMLACELAARCGAVTGIDRDERMVGLARERGRGFPAVTCCGGIRCAGISRVVRRPRRRRSRR